METAGKQYFKKRRDHGILSNNCIAQNVFFLAENCFLSLFKTPDNNLEYDVEAFLHACLHAYAFLLAG